MAIEPFRQRIGIASPGSLISGNAPQVSDVGAALRDVGRTIVQAVEPGMKRKAIEAGEQAAGAAAIQRDEQGNAIKIERPAGGGELFNAAFDKVAETRYLNQVSYDFQNALNTEVNDRRVGKDGKTFDPDQFDAAVQGRLEGVLETVDPALRPAVEGELFREALERTRAFRDEWGRTTRGQAIAGAKDQLELVLNGLANFDKEGLTWDQAWSKYGSKADSLIRSMRDAQQIGPEEFEGLLMRVDKLVESGEKYVEDMGKLVVAAPIVSRMSTSDLDAMDNYINGVNSGEITGISTQVVGGAADAWGTMIQIESGGEQFGKNGEPLRSPAGAIGIAQVMEGTGPEAAKLAGVAWDRDKWLNDADYNMKIGKAYFDMLVRRYNGDQLKAAAAYNGGMRRVDQAIRDKGGQWTTSEILPDETKDYIAKVQKGSAAGQSTLVSETPEAKQFTFDIVSRMDPSAKQSLSRLISRRRQQINDEETIARQQAAEAKRAAEEQANFDRVVNTINGNNTNGVGGDGTYNAEAKGVLDSAFVKNFDLAKINDPNEQKRILAWVQDKNYVPATVINYMENAAVSPNWKQAATFYNSMKQATLPTGGVVGDLMLSKLSPRSRAILEQVTALVNSRQPDEVILPFIDRARTGATYTPQQAIGEYNASLRSSRNPQPYDNDRRNAIIEAFDLPSGQAIPPNLSNLIDQSFAANLDLFNRDPEQALAKAIEQNKTLYTRSGIFNGGFGPSIIQRTLGGDPAVANKNLLRFFQDMRSNGKPILPVLTDSKGRRIPHTVGGPNSTIRLIPLDTQTTSIGMYRVDVIHPETKQVIKLRERFDMGSEMRTWMQTLSAKPAQKPKVDVNAARQKQEAIGRRLTNAFVNSFGP